MTFLKNSWYLAGSSKKLDKTPHRIKLLGEKLALLRAEKGDAAATGNICPNRFASSGQGKVIARALQCPYHELRFDWSGTCVRPG